MVLIVDIGSLLYAVVNVFHPDWLISSNFQLSRSNNLHRDSHQNSWIYPRVKTVSKPTALKEGGVGIFGFVVEVIS